METNGKKAKTNYILIDYENVQPTSLILSSDFPFKVIIFVGVHQVKIPLDLAMAMQSLGNDGEYVRIEGVGKNALDFHLAFYLGKFLERDPLGYFHIISKDSGFDLLIQHLRSKKVLIQRCEAISDIPILKPSSPAVEKSDTAKEAEFHERVEDIRTFLIGRGNAKPRKVTTLSNAINALFGKTLSPSDLDQLVKELARREFITIDGQSVQYKLTNS